MMTRILLLPAIISGCLLLFGCGPISEGLKEQYAQQEDVSSDVEFNGYYMVINPDEVNTNRFKFMAKFGAPLALPLNDDGDIADFPKPFSPSDNYEAAKTRYARMKAIAEEYVSNSKSNLPTSRIDKMRENLAVENEAIENETTPETSIASVLDARITMQPENEVPYLQAVYYDLSSAEKISDSVILPSIVASSVNERIKQDQNLQEIFNEYKQYALAYNREILIPGLKVSGFMFTKFENENAALLIDDNKSKDENRKGGTPDVGYVFYVFTEKSGEQSIYLARPTTADDERSVGDVFSQSSKLSTDVKVNGIAEIFEIIKKKQLHKVS